MFDNNWPTARNLFFTTVLWGILGALMILFINYQGRESQLMQLEEEPLYVPIEEIQLEGEPFFFIA